MAILYHCDKSVITIDTAVWMTAHGSKVSTLRCLPHASCCQYNRQAKRYELIIHSCRAVHSKLEEACMRALPEWGITCSGAVTWHLQTKHSTQDAQRTTSMHKTPWSVQQLHANILTCLPHSLPCWRTSWSCSLPRHQSPLLHLVPCWHTSSPCLQPPRPCP